MARHTESSKLLAMGVANSTRPHNSTANAGRNSSTLSIANALFSAKPCGSLEVEEEVEEEEVEEAIFLTWSMSTVRKVAMASLKSDSTVFLKKIAALSEMASCSSLALGLRAISTSSFKRPASKHSSSKAPQCARCMEGSLVEEEEADVEANRIFVHKDSNSAS